MGFTKTLNVDIWDYWHILTISAIAYVIFDSYIIGIVIALLLSDYREDGDVVAKPWQSILDLKVRRAPSCFIPQPCFLFIGR